MNLTSRINISDVALAGISQAEWDDFAGDCDASIRGSFRYLSILRFRTMFSLVRRRLRIVEIHLGTERDDKIGQAAILVTGNRFVFIDRLMLLPQHESVWSDAMGALMNHLGSGFYEYGWTWSLEASRKDQFAAIPGVQVLNVRDLEIHFVDFAQFPDWDAYISVISTNAKRNARKAAKTFDGLRIVTYRGFDAARHSLAQLRLRISMYRRKKIHADFISILLSYFTRAAVHGNRSFATIAMNGKEQIASISGVIFGKNTFYLDGGRDAHLQYGGSWYLMIETLRAAFNSNPTGKFVMGYVDPSTHDEDVGGGLIRSRRACKVTEFPTAILTLKFSCAGPDGN